MKKYLAILITTLATFAIYSQGAPNIGNNGVLYWNPNPIDDGVIRYNIYLITGTTTQLIANTTGTNININTFITKNGTYGAFVSAVNINGEGPASTNVFFKYFANKPIQVVGVDAK